MLLLSGHQLFFDLLVPRAEVPHRLYYREQSIASGLERSKNVSTLLTITRSRPKLLEHMLRQLVRSLKPHQQMAPDLTYKTT